MTKRGELLSKVKGARGGEVASGSGGLRLPLTCTPSVVSTNLHRDGKEGVVVSSRRQSSVSQVPKGGSAEESRIGGSKRREAGRDPE